MDALPRRSLPLRTRRPVDLGDGRFVVGDHRDTPSIQGALVSGRRGATAVLAHLGLGPAAPSGGPDAPPLAPLAPEAGRAR